MHARCLSGRLLASSSLIALAVAASASDVLANPKDGKVVAGQAEILDRGNGRLEIQQTSQKAAIDWGSFSIGQGEHTHFAQPGADAVALNRVIGSEASTIAGRLSADGRIILLNQNGILFTETARVDVAGLIASTSRLDTQDFMADRYRFTPSHNPAAQVVNRGLITVRDGGLAALVAPWVENSGIINARFGKVVLASGEAFTADLWGDGLVRLDVTDESHIRGVSHAGAIGAEGGVVALSVAEASGLVDRAINMDGVVEATRVAQVGGRILLEGGDGGSVQVAGTLDASGQEHRGGEVAIAAGRIELADSARIDVSGPAGGGEARIGGAFRGGPPLPERKPAREVLVAEGARIDADATVAGDGGTIVVWSEDTTRFAGAASARGGPAGGDGGLIETSGRLVLDVDGSSISASAPNGASGTWLLDPSNVRIADEAGSGFREQDGVFTPGGGEFPPGFGPDEVVIPASLIVKTLETGTDVTVLTASNADAAGNISVEAPVKKTDGDSRTLNLIAHNNINIGIADGELNAGSIESSDGPLNVNLTAGGDVRIVSDLATSGGNLKIVADGSVDLRDTSVRSADLDFDGRVIRLGGSFFTSGSQMYRAPVEIADTSIVAEDGRIEFSDTVEGVFTADPSFFGKSLSINAAGDVVFGRSVGTASRALGNYLAELSISAESVRLGGDINAGSLSISGATRLASDVEVQILPSGRATFSGPVDGTEAGAQSLTVQASNAAARDVEFGAAVGGEVRLASLEVEAANIALSDVTTEGPQTYTGSVVFSSTFLTNGGDFLVDGPLLLTGVETVVDTTGGEGDGDITFSGTIDGAANSLTLLSGDGSIEAEQPIGGQGALGILAVDTSFTPAPPVGQNVTVTPGQPASIPIELPADTPPATANRTLRVSGLEDLPPGTVVSDGVTSVTTPTGSDAQTFANVDALTVTPPLGFGETLSFDVQVADVDPGQVSLPSGESLQVAQLETDVSDPTPVTVAATLPPPPPEVPPAPPSPEGPPAINQPPSTNPGEVSVYLNQGLEFAIPEARPARWPDITPIVPSAAQIQAQIPRLLGQIEPAGPGESAESKAAREQVAELEQALAATYDPWEACPEVGAVSTAWQNTPADAAFNYDPAMLPYSVDVYCGGYQLTGPARGAVRDYSGLSFVTRDFWTDRRQAVSSEVLQELRAMFGLGER